MWKNINESLIFIAEDIDISNIEITNNIVYFSGNGKMTFKGSTICHFLHKQLIEEMTIDKNKYNQ